jgi:hypothetical protein
MGSSDYVRSAIRKLALTVGSGRTVGANSRYAVCAPEQMRSEYRERRREILEMEKWKPSALTKRSVPVRACVVQISVPNSSRWAGLVLCVTYFGNVSSFVLGDYLHNPIFKLFQYFASELGYTPSFPLRVERTELYVPCPISVRRVSFPTFQRPKLKSRRIGQDPALCQLQMPAVF